MTLRHIMYLRTDWSSKLFLLIDEQFNGICYFRHYLIHFCPSQHRNLAFSFCFTKQGPTSLLYA